MEKTLSAHKGSQERKEYPKKGVSRIELNETGPAMLSKMSLLV
jgi:hypothetical protein